MKVIKQQVLLLLATSGCLAFHSGTLPSSTISAGLPTRSITPRSCARQQQALRMSFHVDASVVEALSQATYILVADSSRGGAVVDQIPYVPAETVVDFDKIVAGSTACVLAYAWAAYEFGKRIVTQRACEVCEGSGLVNSSRSGRKLQQPMKCYACGGFLPWENWGRFWQSNMNVGNGGVLQRPASDYDELNEAAREAKRSRAQDQDE